MSYPLAVLGMLRSNPPRATQGSSARSLAALGRSGRLRAEAPQDSGSGSGSGSERIRSLIRIKVRIRLRGLGPYLDELRRNKRAPVGLVVPDRGCSWRIRNQLCLRY